MTSDDAATSAGAQHEKLYAAERPKALFDAVVAIAITLVVYGTVALIVKMDDTVLLVTAVAAKTDELLKALRDKGIETLGEPVAWFYDPPWTLPFRRRNEVAVLVG